MTKYLRIVFSNGEAYEIPAMIIASSRATYYAGVDIKNDPKLKFDEVYQKELDYSMSDGGELIDWASNNMNWSDVEAVAEKVLIEDLSLNYQEEWVNCENRSFVDHD